MFPFGTALIAYRVPDELSAAVGAASAAELEELLQPPTSGWSSRYPPEGTHLSYPCPGPTLTLSFFPAGLPDDAVQQGADESEDGEIIFACSV